MKSRFQLILITLILTASAWAAGTRGRLPRAAAADTSSHAASHAAVAVHPDSIMPDSLAAADNGENGDALEPAEADDASDHAPISVRLQRLLDNDIFQRTQVGLYVYDLTADTLVFAYHERQCMRPASNEKVVTAITALHTLGTNYEYRTRFYTEGTVSDSVLHGHLWVRAGYDPLLDADDLRAVTDSLRSRGIRGIEGEVRTDLSFKDDKRLGWGWCWDDKEVPLTPLLLDNRDRFAEGMRQALRRSGIGWAGTVSEGRVPESARPLCTRTHHIDQVLLPMMKHSDNSMAESMFYQIAAHESAQPATRRRAAQAVDRLIAKVGLDPQHYQIADGSGLSLYNYLTPELLGRLLRFAYRDEGIYRHLRPALPIAGEDGTLRKRMRGTSAQGNVVAKTGTVEGVSTLAGYCTAASGNVLCFSIMNQGVRHTSTGRNFQDRVCRVLTF